MTDYRFWYQADFRSLFEQDNLEDKFMFSLQAVKPSRIAV
jgi:hypothetical protein